MGQESYETYLIGRQSGATPSTNPLDDWYSTITDDVDSYGLGGTWTVKPDATFVRFFYRNQRIAGYNDLYSPPGVTPNIAVPIAQAADTDFETLSAELAFKLREHWGFAIGGWLESYDINDLATVGLSNYMPGGFFLAGNDLGYQGDVIYIRASFRD